MFLRDNHNFFKHKILVLQNLCFTSRYAQQIQDYLLEALELGHQQCLGPEKQDTQYELNQPMRFFPEDRLLRPS